MDGTDADGEWSDEELLQSGSQTGVSETEQEEGYRRLASRPKTPFSAASPLYGHHVSHTGADPTRTQQTGVDHTGKDHTSTMATGTNPVDLILDKIDAELESMDLTDSKSPWELNTGDRSMSCPPRHDSSRSRSAPVGCADSANGGTASSSLGNNYGNESVRSQLYGPAEDYRGTGPMNGYSSPRSNLDIPSDLDPQSAHQIDMKFKEIMRKKKVHQDSSLHSGKTVGSLSSRLRTRSATRPSAMMLSTGYGTDNESVKTEEFETRFMGLMVAPTDTERVDAPVRCTDSKPPTGHTGHTKRYNKYKTPVSPPGLTPQDEELLQRLVKISEETKASHPQSIISRPRSLSPTRMSLQRHRTADNLRNIWDSSDGGNKRGNQLFSWDDDFWKQTTRKGPHSISSSASTFEEVESLCLSKSSSDSMSSTQRPWERIGQGGGGQGQGLWGSKRRFISRQSSTTSTSTSRSSGLLPDHAGAEADGGHNSNASIADTLLESMELLGARGNLDLADKIYLEKIFHRVLDWNNGMPVSSATSSNAMDKHFWGSVQQAARDDQRDANSPRSHMALKEKLEKLTKCENSPIKSKPSLSPLSVASPNTEKKRRRDLIIPDDEESVSASYRQYKSPNPSSKPGPLSRTASYSSRDTTRSKDYSAPESVSKYSYLSSMSSLSMDNGSLRGSPQGSMAPPTHHPNLSTFLPPPLRLSGSFESTASPPDTYMFNQPYTTSHAERVLMGLGFGATEGFLPERFLRDWYMKISKAQMEAQMAAQAELKIAETFENPPTFSPATFQQNLPSDANSDQRPAHRRDSHVSTASSILDEATSYLPASNGQESKIQRLKEYIAAYSNNSQSPTEGRDFKVRHFATSRQKSLPLYLETLSEEEEGRSRISGVDPFDKEARLQMFISDAMSSSGKSTGSNSENSYISSNQSESDSMSSCSEKRSHSSQQLHIQHQHAYKRHLAEQKQLEKNRRQNDVKSGDRSSTGKQLKAGDDAHKGHSKKSPVRQITVKRNENIGVKTVAEAVDSSQTEQPSGIGSESPSSTVEDKCKNSLPQTLNQKPQKRDSMHSKDSLEVEDIMQNQSSKNSRVAKAAIGLVQANALASSTDHLVSNNVEPAMVSIVLEDVDRDATGSIYDNMLSMSYLGLPASRCSSSSLSPIPQSPVTVIEVGLDNQQDSLDTEGTGSSKETDDDVTATSATLCEDGVYKKIRRSKSRCSGAYKRSSPDDLCFRRNSGTQSPIPNFLNRVSPSTEYRELQPRRRLSLEVPLMPEVRQMLDRQRALSVNQICDNYHEHEPPRRDSKRRASFSEEDPVIINDVLAEQRKGSQEHLNNSPTGKTAVKRKNSGEVIEQRNEVKSGLDMNHNGSHVTAVHATNQLQRTVSQTEDTCRCCTDSKLSQQNSTGVDTPAYSDKPQFDTSISRSNESSPGSAKSAFRVATRSRKDGPCSGYFSEVSETDIDEFPKSMMPTYNPRLISSISKTLQSQGSDAETPKTETEDCNQVTSPTLTFSDTRPSVRDIRSGQGAGDKVYSISRAVQVNDLVFNQRHPSVPHLHSHLHHGTSYDAERYFACDRETQCSFNGDDFSSRHYSELGIGRFHKFTQTGVPTFEMSCQTNESVSNVTKQERLPGTYDRTMTSESRAVNTVVSLIGREHDNEMSASNLVMTQKDFQLVDETLKLIEDELNIIETKGQIRNIVDSKEQIRNIISTQIFAHEIVSCHQHPDLDPVLRGRIKSTPNDQSSLMRPTLFKHRSRSLSTDERLPARFAPSTWMDATKLYTSLDDSAECHDNLINCASRIDEDSVFSETVAGSNKYGAPTERWYPKEDERVFPNKGNGFIRSDSHIGLNQRDSFVEAGENSAFYNPRQSAQDKLYHGHEPVRDCTSRSSGNGSSSEDYPTVNSQSLMVKMFELQQDLTSSLNPWKDNSEKTETDNSVDLPEDTVGVRSESPDNYDLANENVNATFRLQTQSKVSEWRRFSLPILEERVPSKRGHSKLSRLKYQNNSSQNSYKSLDLETDFMHANGPLGSLGYKSFGHRVSPETKSSELSLGRTMTTFLPQNLDVRERIEEAVHLLQNDVTCRSSGKADSGVKTEIGHLLDTALKREPSSVSKLHKPMSPLMTALREDRSPGSVGSGKSTPEILISPLRAFQVDFLQVPGSPKDYLTKAVYPTISASPTSPQSSSPLTEVTQASSCTTNDAQVFIFGKYRQDWSKSRKDSSDLRRLSMAESDLPASTIGSTTDLSRKSSVDHSADEFSDASMLPRLSMDSALDELKTEENEVEIKCDIDDIGKQLKPHVLEKVEPVSPDFDLDILKNKPEPVDSAASSPADSSRQDSLEVEHASNKSLDGSDNDRDIDDVDICEYGMRSTRLSSASSYSDAMLDNLSQDSSSEDGKPKMNYLTVDDHIDDLLQVSDYGGVSPSPTHMKRDFQEDFFSPDRADGTTTESYPATPERGAPTTTRNQVKTISRSPKDMSDSDDDHYDAAKERREMAQARFSRDRRNSKDNWDVVQSVLLWQSREDDVGEVLTIDDSKVDLKPTPRIDSNNKDSSVKLEVSKDGDSSGDECDKEILRINLSLPLRGRLVKMTSDPVDKDIYCLAVKQTSVKNMSPVPELKEEIKPADTVKLFDMVQLLAQDSDEAVVTGCENNSTGLLEMFQKAELSDLQQITHFVGEPEVGPTFYDEFVGLRRSSPQPTISQDLDHFDNCCTAHIVDVEFTDDDEKILSGSQQGSLDDPNDLIDDLEMLALFKKIDEFNQGSSLIQEESSGSSPRRFPLSQISEEETMSEETASDGSRGYPWSVRSRFILAQENPEFSSFTLSESPRSPNIISADFFIDVGVISCPESKRDLLQQNSAENGSDSSQQPFHSNSRIAEQQQSSESNLESIHQQSSENNSNLELIDQQSSANKFDSTQQQSSGNSSSLESTNQQSSKSEFYSKQKLALSKQLIEPMLSFERDMNSITQPCSQADDVFTEERLQHFMEFGQGVQPGKENSIYSRTKDTDLVDIKIRAVSPASKVFDFAQSLMENNMKADQQVNDSFDSVSRACSIRGESFETSISQNTSSDHSFDAYSLSPLSGSPKPPSIETHTVETKIDMLGNITTRFASTHTMRFNNLNIPSGQSSPLSSLSDVSSPHSSLSGPSSPHCSFSGSNSPRSTLTHIEEKHISAISINIGDYRRKEKENCSEAKSLKDEMSFTKHLPEKSMKNSEHLDTNVTKNGLSEKQVTNNTLSGTSQRRNRILRAFKKKFSTDGLNGEQMLSLTSTDSCHGVDTTESSWISQEEMKDRVRSLFLLGGQGDSEVAYGVDNEVKHQKGKIGMKDDELDVEEKPNPCDILPQSSFTTDAGQDDLKSRVKAMFLIGDQRKSPLLNQDQLSDDGSQTAARNHRAKVTTMFSRNSKEARTSFASTSISEYEDSPDELFESTQPKNEGLRNIRTQLSSRAGTIPETSQARAGKKQRPRSLRTRDSLLKLHEQPNVSSSVGSDTDSELTSALRHQGDYDIRERDLALRRISSDVIDEEEASVHNGASLPLFDDTGARVGDSATPSRDLELVAFNSPVGESVVNATSLSQSVETRMTCHARDVHTPRVVIQQASEDSQITQENLRKLNLPLLNAAAFASPVNGQENTDHFPISTKPELNDTKYRYLKKHGSSNAWLRRFPRMQFLSPNSALTQKKNYDYLPSREYYARSNDGSHPELSYLDILPKLGQQTTSEPSHNAIKSGSPTFRYTMTSPEPKPAGNDVFDMNIVTVSGDFSIVLQADDSDEVNCFTEQSGECGEEGAASVASVALPENKSAEAVAEVNDGTVDMDDGTVDMDDGTVDMDDGTVDMDDGTVDMDDGTVDMHDGLNLIRQDTAPHNQVVHDDNNVFALVPLGSDPKSEQSALIDLLEMPSDPAIARLGTDKDLMKDKFASTPSVFGQPMESQLPDTLSTSHSRMSHPSGIDALLQLSEPCLQDSLRPCSESGEGNLIRLPDDPTYTMDALRVVTHAKKLLSVTSHDSGFESQGSPIDLASARVMELIPASFCAVEEETKNDSEI